MLPIPPPFQTLCKAPFAVQKSLGSSGWGGPSVTKYCCWIAGVGTPQWQSSGDFPSLLSLKLPKAAPDAVGPKTGELGLI